MTHTCRLQMPNQESLFDHIEENAKHRLPMVEAGTRIGRSVVICGAGPSLRNAQIPLASEVWACNSALPYLKKRLRVTHGFSIDQGTAMLDEWQKTFNVEYLVASSVHPSLVNHLLERNRQVRYFHSYLGIPDPEGKKDHESYLYANLFPTSVRVGYGLNSVPRAVCLALAMGFSSITVLGADCGVQGGPEMPLNDDAAYDAWLSELTLYADGRKASVYGEGASMCEAIIDGKRWHTRPDMIISAVHLLELEAESAGRIKIVGDTLPNALRGKDEAFMSCLPKLSGVGEVTNLRTERVA